MIIWRTNFQTHQTAILAQTVTIARQKVGSEDYYWDGAKRTDSPHIVFQYTISGYGIFEYKGKKTKIGPHAAFLCNAKDSDVRYYYPKEAKKPWEFIWFIIIGKVASNCVQHINENYGYIINVNPTSSIINTFLDFGVKNPAFIELPLAKNSQITYTLLTNLDQEQENNTAISTNDFIVKEAKKIIQEALYKNINVTEVAQKLNITREHLSRVFKKNTGINISAYIIKQKINEAFLLLMETHKNVSDIAEKLGFNSCSDFIQFFKKHTGQTPKQFRKKPLSLYTDSADSM